MRLSNLPSSRSPGAFNRSASSWAQAERSVAGTGEGRHRRPPNTADMDGSVRSSSLAARFGSQTAVVVALLLIFVALLGIGNEIRYQGCVERMDQQALIAATQDPRNPAPVGLECHRMPFK